MYEPMPLASTIRRTGNINSSLISRKIKLEVIYMFRSWNVRKQKHRSHKVLTKRGNSSQKNWLVSLNDNDHKPNKKHLFIYRYNPTYKKQKEIQIVFGNGQNMSNARIFVPADKTILMTSTKVLTTCVQHKLFT